MALVTRIARLFKADFHAVLDQLEEPGQLLKQAIREMEDELAIADKRLRLCAHEQAALDTRRGELERSIAEIDEELDLCFASQKSDLARSLVRKKLEAWRIVKRLNSRHAANDKYLAELNASLEENRATLDGLRQKAEIFADSAAQADDAHGPDDAAWLARDLVVNDDEVEVAFLREKNLRSGS